MAIIESGKPNKQRRAVAEMPLHLMHKYLSANLSKPLRKSLSKRSLPVRKGDKVKIMRGSNYGFEGKIIEVNYKKQRVFIEKLIRKKSDGTEKPLPIHPSNLMITEIDKSDAQRIRGGQIGKKESKKEEKAVEPQAKEEKAKVSEAKKKHADKNKKVKKDGKKR